MRESGRESSSSSERVGGVVTQDSGKVREDSS